MSAAINEAAPHVQGVACEMRGTGIRWGSRVPAPSARGSTRAATAETANVAARPAPLRTRVEVTTTVTFSVGPGPGAGKAGRRQRVGDPGGALGPTRLTRGRACSP